VFAQKSKQKTRREEGRGLAAASVVTYWQQQHQCQVPWMKKKRGVAPAILRGCGGTNHEPPPPYGLID